MVSRHAAWRRRSVYRWLAAFVSGGQQALEAKEIPGRPAKLTEEHLRWLAGAVRNLRSKQDCVDFALWTLGSIGALLEKQFGLKVSRATVGRAMRALGFTLRRPLYQARERDPVLVAAWEREQFPAIAREAKRLGADDAGMRSAHHAGWTWAPIGQTPIFFGRETETTRLLECLATAQGQRLLGAGRSGSGESSLVRARLWARLHDPVQPPFGGATDWTITAMKPAAQRDGPFHSLVHALCAHELPGLCVPDPDRQAGALREQDGAFATLVEQVLGGAPAHADWLLIVDRFKELPTSADQGLSRDFLYRLIAALALPRLRVVATVRSDFLDH